jgi:conjugative relaxase-like TrwC/TraI family protein
MRFIPLKFSKKFAEIQNVWTCQVIKNGSTYLSKHLTSNDYYDEHQKIVGHWHGIAAEKFGIAGQEIGPQDEKFERLRNNKHPIEGGALTQRTADERRAFFDFQVSAPKSVSILAVTFDDNRLRQAHEESVSASFAILEKFASRRERRGEAVKGNENVFTGNLIAARFTHDASRNLDAQLHTHMVVANVTHDEKSKKWFALQNSEMFKTIALAGRVYQAELAKRVKALGYDIVEDRENGKIQGFEIAGVTVEDREKQSTRRAQIEAEIEKFHLDRGRMPTAAERHVMATETRGKKLVEVTTEVVRAGQLSRYDHVDQVRLGNVIKNARARPPAALDISTSKEHAREAVDFAIAHRFERDGVLTYHELATTALEENLGRVDLEGIHAALQDHNALVTLEVPADSPREKNILTTKEYLTFEYNTVRMVDDSAEKHPTLGNSDGISDKLAPDQRIAVTKLLASKDAVMALRGPAGAGKTFTLQELNRLLKASGKESIFVTPTHAAKTVLQKDGFSDADTVSQLMQDIKHGRSSLENKVLIVDESGMLSAKQGFSLLNAALSQGARVVLVGDEKQLLSVEAGDFLGNLKKYSTIKVAELTEIRRQKDDTYRNAMTKMSQGKLIEGLEMLDATGRIIEGKSNYIENAVSSYFSKSENAETCLIVSPTWREIDTINEQVRATRKIRGELSGTEYETAVMDGNDWTKAQKQQIKLYQPGMCISPWMNLPGLNAGKWYRIEAVKDGHLQLTGGKLLNVKRNGSILTVAEEKKIKVQVGDRLLLQGNDKKAGLINGDVVSIADIKDNKISVTKGKKVITIPATYRTFCHGYAVTTEKSQGATVDNVIVAGANMSGRRIYVATSRGRKSVEVHVPDKSPLVQSARRGIEKRASALGRTLSPSLKKQRSRIRNLHLRAEKFRRMMRQRFINFHTRTRSNSHERGI